MFIKKKVIVKGKHNGKYKKKKIREHGHKKRLVH